MTETIQATLNTLLKIIWLSMTASPVTIWIALVVMNKISVLPISQTEFSEYVFYAGLLFILPASALLRSFKAINKNYLLDRQQAVHSSKKPFEILKMKMVFGLAVADMPASLGLVYYFMSGDLDKSIILIASSFILCFLFKPVLPYPC